MSQFIPDMRIENPGGLQTLRFDFQSEGFFMILVIANKKGGQGKTFIATLLLHFA
jgi:hypothetical protein